MNERKPILCVDFDGVIHSYTSGWQGADVVLDPPVDGAIQFLTAAVEMFEVHVFSSRSNQRGGMRAMKSWLEKEFMNYWGAHPVLADDAFSEIKWPKTKPPALVTLDDRAMHFTGSWPELETIANFKPWNK